MRSDDGAEQSYERAEMTEYWLAAIYLIIAVGVIVIANRLDRIAIALEALSKGEWG